MHHLQLEARRSSSIKEQMRVVTNHWQHALHFKYIIRPSAGARSSLVIHQLIAQVANCKPAASTSTDAARSGFLLLMMCAQSC